MRKGLKTFYKVISIETLFWVCLTGFFFNLRIYKTNLFISKLPLQLFTEKEDENSLNLRKF